VPYVDAYLLLGNGREQENAEKRQKDPSFSIRYSAVASTSNQSLYREYIDRYDLEYLGVSHRILLPAINLFPTASFHEVA
jgi:hypothetical protein